MRTQRIPTGNGYLYFAWEDGAGEPVQCWLSMVAVDTETLWQVVALRPEVTVRPFGIGYLLSDVLLTSREARYVMSGADPVMVALGHSDGLWARPLTDGELMSR